MFLTPKDVCVWCYHLPRRWGFSESLHLHRINSKKPNYLWTSLSISCQRMWISKNHVLPPFAQMRPLSISPSGNSQMSQVVWMSYVIDRALLCLSYVIHQPGCQIQVEGFPEHCMETWAHSPCWNRYSTPASQAIQHPSPRLHFADAGGF